MKKDFWESILFLIVGLLAGFHGAFDLININRQDASIWWIAWSVFRVTAGLIAVILGARGVLRSGKG